LNRVRLPGSAAVEYFNMPPLACLEFDPTSCATFRHFRQFSSLLSAVALEDWGSVYQAVSSCYNKKLVKKYIWQGRVGYRRLPAARYAEIQPNTPSIHHLFGYTVRYQLPD